MNSFSKARLNKGAVVRFDNGLLNTCFLRHFSFHLFHVFRALRGKIYVERTNSIVNMNSFSATFARVLSSMPCNDLLDMLLAKLSMMR